MLIPWHQPGGCLIYGTNHCHLVAPKKRPTVLALKCSWSSAEDSRSLDLGPWEPWEPTGNASGSGRGDFLEKKTVVEG